MNCSKEQPDSSIKESHPKRLSVGYQMAPDIKDEDWGEKAGEANRNLRPPQKPRLLFSEQEALPSASCDTRQSA